MQLFFHAQQLLRLFFLDAGHGHARPAAHYVLNVLAANNAGSGIVEVILVAQGAQVFALLAFLVGVEARLLEFVVGNGRVHAVHNELDALLHLGDLCRQRCLAELYARAGFVDEIDRLVGQEAVGNVAIRMRDRKLDRGIGVADRVELLVAVLDAVDDLDGVGLVWRRNLDSLEAPFQRAIFLDGLAVLSRRGGADALNFAARERRLEDVGRVERALSRARTYERVQLVDEDDGVLILHQFLHDGLEPLLELAAVLGAGHDKREVEAEDFLVGQEAGHFAVGDALGKAFNDSRLAYAGLTDEDWVVLGTAAKNLHHAFEFAVATHERIKLSVHRRLRKVAAELGQQTRLALTLRRRSLLLRDAGQLFANLRQLQSTLLQNF